MFSAGRVFQERAAWLACQVNRWGMEKLRLGVLWSVKGWNSVFLASLLLNPKSWAGAEARHGHGMGERLGMGKGRSWGIGRGRGRGRDTDMGRNTGTGICLLPRLSSHHLCLASFGSFLAFLCVSSLHPNWRQN